MHCRVGILPNFHLCSLTLLIIAILYGCRLESGDTYLLSATWKAPKVDSFAAGWPVACSGSLPAARPWLLSAIQSCISASDLS
ncbi:hypothetical protein BJX66DRAFT_10769 [Aspergillus keveii]|uniref:Secreted protein n=1 Tax=Aspergillus keveii TaxID=714993 RepID=A0ABR4GS65_9EURO